MAKRLIIKPAIIFLLLIKPWLSPAQVMLMPEVQTNGVIMKQQVWSLLINNMTGQVVKANLSVSVIDRNTSQPLLQASSGILLLNTGVKRVMYNDLQPMNYTLAVSGFGMDRQLNQPLPVGEYLICYNLTDAENKQLQLSNECIKVVAEPLAPPQLIIPEDDAVIPDPRPVLTWTPPAPVYMFNSLSYDIVVTPVYDKQSPQEAIQRNIPAMTTATTNNSLAYPSSYTNLAPGKKYAWQVVAKDAANYGGKSEVWTFTVMPDSVQKILSYAPYIKLQKQNPDVTVLHQGFLKLEYFNTLPDSMITVEVYPIREKQGKQKAMLSFELKVKPGMNFLEKAIRNKMRFNETEVYELKLTNSRKEYWYMRFNPKYYF
jgi:hypothetical protein